MCMYVDVNLQVWPYNIVMKDIFVKYALLEIDVS